MASLIHTPACDLFGIKHPILNAGMDVVASPELAAAVTNAGGLGVFGGVHYSPRLLRQKLEDLVEGLDDKNAPFGVDLALPPVGGNARKTNYDYTHGKLDELIDIIIEFKPKLFISALGVPPVSVVQRLHKAGILVMNMVGHPKHVAKALESGVDLLCAQGGEAGGHTGDIPFSILIPAIVDACKGARSPITGGPVYVIAAGAVHSGRSLAAALSYGAIAVWVGTLFIASEEGGSSERHKQAVLDCDHDGTSITLIFSGRPLRVRATPTVRDWETNRQAEIQKMVKEGIVPVGMDDAETRPYLMGKVAAMVKTIRPARQIVDEMVAEAVTAIKTSNSYLVKPRSGMAHL